MAVEIVYFPDKAAPLTESRSLAECFVAGDTFRAQQLKIFSDYSEKKTFYIRSTAWISSGDFAEAIASKSSIIADGVTLASWTKDDLLGDSSGLALSASFEVYYAWHLLKVNEQLISRLSENLIDGQVHTAANVEGVIHLGRGSKILPGVFIEGNVTIGENCKIGPNCYIRGNTSIGDNCHIGQSVEIKNCIIMNKTNVGHLSYVGDSILGNGANFGAGTTTSNLRHDNGNHRSLIDGALVDTGRRKFGVIIGDGVHTGINTSFYPGRKMSPGASTLPAEVVKYDKES